MGSRIDKPLRGVAFLEDAWVSDNIDDSASSYTERDPRPGVPTVTDANWRSRPQVLGVQREPVTFIGTIAGGYPGTDEQGGGLSYYFPDRQTPEAIEAARHWRPPWVLSGAQAFTEQAASTTIATTSLSGHVIVGFPADSAAGPTYVWDPEDGSWSTNPNAPDGEGCLCAVPGSDRVLWISERGISWYSDDFGATWVELSRYQDFIDTAGGYNYNSNSRSACFDGQGQVLWIGKRFNANTVDLWLSPDGGLSWSLAHTLSAKRARLARHPSGKIFFQWIDTNDDVLGCFLFSAADNPSIQDTQTLWTTGTYTQCYCAVDDDGITYAFGQSTAMYFCYSPDEGQTWIGADSVLSVQHFPISDSVAYDETTATFSHGWMFRADSLTSPTDLYAAVSMWGGWRGPYFERMEGGFTALNLARQLRHRLDLRSTRSTSWWCYGNPADTTGHGFTLSSSGSTTVARADGGLRLTVSAAATYSYEWSRTIASSDATAWDVFLSYGVSVKDEDLAGAARVYVSADSHSFSIRHDEDAFWVYDEDDAAKIGADITHSNQARLDIELYYDDSSGTITILWREYGVGTVWNTATRTLTGTLGGTPTAVSVDWGHPAAPSAATQSVWYYLTVMTDFDPAQDHSAPVYLEGRAGWGKTVGSVYPYPIPDLYDATAQRQGKVLVRSGPLTRDSTIRHDVAPDYPIEAVFPTVSPSPTTPWRSASRATQTLAVEFADYVGKVGHSWTFGVMVRGANFRTMTLDGLNAAGSYAVSLGTMDLAVVAGGGYTLLGRVLYPQIPYTGSPSGRYIWPGELRGGYVVLDTGGTPIARRIVHNSGGRWGTYLDAPPAQIVLEGVDGTEAASGLCDIVAPNGVIWFHRGIGSAAIRGLRATITYSPSTPTNHPLVDDWLEIGSLGVFGLHPTGKQWANGWEWEVSPNTQRTVDSYRSERRTQLGPSQRRLTLDWGDGFTYARTRAANVDWVSAASPNEPLATRDDVFGVLTDWLDLSHGASRPVLWAGEVPATSGTTVTDPTMWMYGWLEPQGIRAQQTTGDEGVDEFYRASGIQIVEVL